MSRTMIPTFHINNDYCMHLLSTNSSPMAVSLMDVCEQAAMSNLY